MTLEAALVIPMVICVITLIILFTYYLYGRCVLSQDAYILAFRASVDKDRYDAAPESTKPQFHVTTGASGKEIKVEADARIRAGAMGDYFLKPRSGWEFKAGQKAKCLEQVKHIRRMTRLKDIIKGWE